MNEKIDTNENTTAGEVQDNVPDTVPAPPKADFTDVKPVRKPRGFAAISPERRSEIARKGGQAAHARGTAHKFTTEEARLAGMKGGNAPHVSRGAPKKPTA
jgi:uncharacterized protein